MYWQVDALCCLLGVTGTILFSLSAYRCPWMIALSLFWVWIYPIILEAIYNFTARRLPQAVFQLQSNSKIVYHPGYNVNLCGLEKRHSFDARKYQKIFERIQPNLKDQPLRPQRLPRSLILECMSTRYLLKLCYGFYVLRKLQLPFWFLPSWYLRWKILNPMLLASEGSILAACLAKKQGWAINLSGGFHHASFNRGGGFCIYPDISLVIHYLQTRLKLQRIMVIDLDAHQGNGYQRDFILQDDIYIVDCYNYKIYPKDYEAKEAIMKNIPIDKSTSDYEYLRIIDSIDNDFRYFSPEFVIFNAGTDPLKGDPLGGLNISPKAIIQRDEKIIQMCIKNKAPVVMLLSGGYHEHCAEVIADSIQNLLHKFS